MAKKKKILGSLGPAAHWLDMSIAERAKTKAYIKEGLQGYERSDGVSIPGARRIFKGLQSGDGYDLRHIERWSAAKLKTARRRIQTLNTLVSRPFAVIVPRTVKQRKAAQKYTEQNLPNQKEFIAQVQIQNRDKAVFRSGKVGIERVFPSGSKTIKQRYLFRDYLRPEESLRENIDEDELDEDEELDDEVLDSPTTIREMITVTKRMLEEMPVNVYGQQAWYSMITPLYGPFGRSVTHAKVLELIQEYANRYDPGGTSPHGRKADFGEHIIGFQMIGNRVQKDSLQLERERIKRMRKEHNKLRVTMQRKPVMCLYRSKKTGKRCERRIGHKGRHQFPK